MEMKIYIRFLVQYKADIRGTCWSQRPPAERVAWIVGLRPGNQVHASALNVDVRMSCKGLGKKNCTILRRDLVHPQGALTESIVQNILYYLDVKMCNIY